MNRVGFGWALFLLALVDGCGGPGSGGETLQNRESFPTADQGQSGEHSGWILRIGSVSQTPKKEIKRFRPLTQYLTDALRPYGLADCEMVVCDCVEKIAEGMKKGEVDIYIDSPWPVVRVCDLCGAVPMLRRWKDGESVYQGVIFVRKESDLTEVKQLLGHLIALDEPTSTSGCLLPLAALAEAGFRLRHFEDTSRTPEPDEVGYVFAGDEENVFFWVLRNKVVAGAMRETKLRQYLATSPEQVRVLLRTASVPRHLVCYRQDLDPAKIAAVREALIGMDQTEPGRQALLQFQRTTKFDPIPGGAEAALEPIRRWMHSLKSLDLP